MVQKTASRIVYRGLEHNIVLDDNEEKWGEDVPLKGTDGTFLKVFCFFGDPVLRFFSVSSYG